MIKNEQVWESILTFLCCGRYTFCAGFLSFCIQEESHSGQTPMCTALWQRKRAERSDGSGSDSAEITMCALVWQRWPLTVLRQRCQLPLLSQWCAHRCHTNVNIAVTALSVDTAVTLVCTVMLQCCHCHRCCTVVILHHWHTNVAAIAVTVLFGPLLSQHSWVHRCHNTVTATGITLVTIVTAVTLVWTAVWQ